MDLLYFASGSSAVGDIRGFARILHPIGVSIPELSVAAEAELLSLAGLPIPVFVDTGAFSEVRIAEGRVEVVAPISEAAWDDRVQLLLRFARALGPQVYVVAPDRVGDQTATLARLRRHVGALGEMRRLGAHVVVPIQRGALSASAFDRAACEALGFDDFVRGIPGNKAAMPATELEIFVRDVVPTEVHLLGLGPRNGRCRALVDVFRRLAPQARLSCDSNLLAASVGRTNGRRGRMRALTGAQHPGAPGSDWMPASSSTTAPSTTNRETAIVLAFLPGLLFERAMRAYQDAGLSVHASTSLQLGLFDEAPEAP